MACKLLSEKLVLTTYTVCQCIVINYALNERVIFYLEKLIDRNIPSDDCEMGLPFKSSRLLVALTLLSASALFVTGSTLFDGIIQLEISKFRL